MTHTGAATLHGGKVVLEIWTSRTVQQQQRYERLQRRPCGPMEAQPQKKHLGYSRHLGARVQG